MSENYRYYRLDGEGHVQSAEWFHALDDEDAIAQIEAQYWDGLCEVWQDKRLVATIAPDRLKA